MMMRNKLQRVNVKGGVLSPGELHRIIEYAEELELDSFHIGSRQDIIFPIENNKGNVVAEHKSYNSEFFSSPIQQNISSSYVSINILNSTVWLRDASYLYILEQFGYEPQLKINIVDPKQQMVPLFFGELNFIASSHEDYWYLFLKLPNREADYYPVLIYTWDIARIAEEIEKNYSKVSSTDELFQLLNTSLNTNNRVIEKQLTIPFTPFPYYEGMNKMGSNQYWLGLYWRNNLYDLKFLKWLCDFCIEYGVGKICLTPWKSLIIKGIPMEGKLTLEKLLGTFGINIRHSALELNWHLPVGDKEALSLKKFLVLNFDQNDISTYGLTFAITSNHNQNRYFTSIVIEKNQFYEISKNHIIKPTYNILYAKNFDPNIKKYIVFAQDIDQNNLYGLLLELTKTYFYNLGVIDNEDTNTFFKDEVIKIEVYQCMDCQTVYDPSVGDVVVNVPAGVEFVNLPTEYCCSLCGNAKNNFKKIILDVV